MNLTDNTLSPNVLTLRGEADGSGEPVASEVSPPLTLPVEVWKELPESERTSLLRAERLLDVFPEEDVTLLELSLASELDPSETLEALRILQGFGLTQVAIDGQNVVARLVARPELHVRVANPGQKPRWVFISRPVEPPDVDPRFLN